MLAASAVLKVNRSCLYSSLFFPPLAYSDEYYDCIVLRSALATRASTRTMLTAYIPIYTTRMLFPLGYRALSLQVIIVSKNVVL